VIEEKRRKSFAVVDREMILNYAATAAAHDSVAKSHMDLDETYMMFGGQQYIKVSN
jgi:hypothetical protein